jgi:hypothetical protein
MDSRRGFLKKAALGLAALVAAPATAGAKEEKTTKWNVPIPREKLQYGDPDYNPEWIKSGVYEVDNVYEAWKAFEEGNDTEWKCFNQEYPATITYDTDYIELDQGHLRPTEKVFLNTRRTISGNSATTKCNFDYTE